MPFECDLDSKYFAALVRGVAKRYYAPEVLTSAAIRKSVFGLDKPDETADSIIENINVIIEKALKEGLDGAGLERLLGALKMKPEHSSAFLAVFQSEFAKLRQALVQKSVWNPCLKGLRWRVDLSTCGKDAEDINEPFALLEFETKVPEAKESEKTMIELSKQSLALLKAECDKIQQGLTS